MNIILFFLLIVVCVIYVEYRVKKHEKDYHTVHLKKKSNFIEKVNDIYYSVGKDN